MASDFGSMTVANLLEMLGKHPARLLALSYDTPTSEALRLLSKRGYRSAPVLAQEGKRAVGFVDNRDLLAGLLSKLSHGKPDEDFAQWKDALQSKECHEAGAEYMSQPVGRLVNRSHTDRMEQVSLSSKVQDVAELMTGLRLHRVAVHSAEGNQLHGVLTASDLVGYLAEHLEFWRGKISAKCAAELVTGDKEEPVAMQEDRPAIEGFQLMARNMVSGIAVVNASGKLTGNLSASDLVHAMGGSASVVPESLFLPAHAFLLKQGRKGAARQPLSVAPEESVEEVVRQMATYRVHRVWVTDKQGRPTAVITPFQVLAQFRRE